MKNKGEFFSQRVQKWVKIINKMKTLEGHKFICDVLAYCRVKLKMINKNYMIRGTELTIEWRSNLINNHLIKSIKFQIGNSELYNSIAGKALALHMANWVWSSILYPCTTKIISECRTSSKHWKSLSVS